jgi:sensor histidine kinase YesM|tara:strand:- start:198 stop:458 length:261 start_codon:yes stop_codon:yes gene_type:complete
MEFVVSPVVLWNIIVSLIVFPIGFIVRSLTSEQKRLDILMNKTREEIAKDYVTRDQIEADFSRLMSTLDRMDEKIDKLQTKTYFQE